jgi:trimethylamine:corrinoid methyltransferase-like protein
MGTNGELFCFLPSGGSAEAWQQRNAGTLAGIDLQNFKTLGEPIAYGLTDFQ